MYTLASHSYVHCFSKLEYYYFGAATILPFCSTNINNNVHPVHVHPIVMETFSSLINFVITIATKYKPHVHTAMGVSIYAVIITTLQPLKLILLWISLVPSPTPSFSSNEANSGSLMS